MNVTKWMLLVTTLVSALAVTGCQKSEGEKLGDEMKDAADKAGDAAKDAGDAVKDAVDKK